MLQMMRSEDGCQGERSVLGLTKEQRTKQSRRLLDFSGSVLRIAVKESALLRVAELRRRHSMEFAPS